MLLQKFLTEIGRIFPAETALEGDRIGLQLQSGVDTVKKVLIAYELDTRVVQEAIEKGVSLIVTFHPLIFAPLRIITDDERVGNLCNLLIKNSIGLYSVHTCYDTHPNGSNINLLNLLGFQFIKHIEPIKGYNEFGMGAIGKSDKEINSNDLINLVANKLNNKLRHSPELNIPINTIAIVVGSGSSYLDKLLNDNIDAFITADLTYHNFHKANGKMLLIDVGHYESEQFVANGIFQILNKEFGSEIELIESKINTNPIQYFENKN